MPADVEGRPAGEGRQPRQTRGSRIVAAHGRRMMPMSAQGEVWNR
jgi:hypothetical protein